LSTEKAPCISATLSTMQGAQHTATYEKTPITPIGNLGLERFCDSVLGFHGKAVEDVFGDVIVMPTSGHAKL
jgi:hypothetical protein